MVKGKKHLNISKRSHIEFALANGDSLRKIAKDIGVGISTVSREIKKHTYESFKGCSKRKNQCVHYKNCTLSGICKDCSIINIPCKMCSYRNCNQYCENVEYTDCSKRIKRSAQVCNGCEEIKNCHKRKLFYVATCAENDYRKVLSEHRQGAGLEVWELNYIDDIVSPKIMAGQSIHHICVTNASMLTRNERTLQRYLNNGLFSAKRGDLKRACMIRPRKGLTKEYQHKVEKGCYIGRTYKDYERFIAQNNDCSPVYMDILIGRKGGVCLLTLHWLNAAFMVGILIPNKCAESVVSVFDKLYEELGDFDFKKLFQVILTDRGTEFSNPSRIEFTKDNTRRTWVFFCDPMNSNQKSQLERNHEIVREILPKGTSFDMLTQNQAYLALSHVNAYIRYVNGNKTPYEVFEFFYGKGMANKLHIKNINPKEVTLKPNLVGIKVK